MSASNPVILCPKRRDLAMPAITTGTIAVRPLRLCVALTTALVCLVVWSPKSTAAEKEPVDVPAASPRLFEQHEGAAPLDADAYITPQPKVVSRQVNFQPPTSDTPRPFKPLIVESPEAIPAPPTQDPCGEVTEKPLGQLGINIAIPAGELPTDHGAVCLASLNTAAVRSFPTFYYQWDATCLCHRPLYFEEVNLERYGYGCGCCLQPLASAAHFFGTVPALPYCMAAECPHECVYTLGHYRPGSCPPWRRHWPPTDPLAAAAEGGVWTGLIFLIP
jgi:hypothetical protein